mgnify:CR=1 FL=1
MIEARTRGFVAPASLRFVSAPAPAPFTPPPANEPDELSLRPRLRLTPTATDDEFRSVFDAAGGRTAAPQPQAPAERGEPSWRKLLSGLESAAPGDAALGEKMAGEILAMGIDPAALLPRARMQPGNGVW